MARKKLPPVAREEAHTVDALLRGLRRSPGYRAVRDASSAAGFPAARQTIYAYERGGLTPSLQQFLELVEFYALKAEPGADAKPVEDLRSQAVAAIVKAMSLPVYHVTEAMRLMARLQPDGSSGARRAG